MDPAVSLGSGTTGGTELAAIYDTLARFNPDSAKYEPRLATSFEPNADASEWTVKLRSGVRFGNGDPFTAGAVKASIARHQDPASASPQRQLSLAIADMQVLDDLTIVFKLAQPWRSFPYLLASEVGMIVNPNVLAQLGKDAFNKLPKGAGAGPYEPVRFAPAEEIVLNAKTDYWGGPVCVQRLRFVVVTGADATYDAVKVGTVNVGFVRDAGVLARARADKANLYTAQSAGGGAILINAGVKGSVTPGTDMRIRQAVMHALDPKAIDDRVFDSAGVPTSALFPSSSPLATSVPGPAYDADKSRMLVQQVKSEGKWDGSIRLACSQAQTSRGQIFETLLNAVGFKVKVEYVQAVTALVIGTPNYDLACWGFAIDEGAPNVNLAQFESKSATNRTGYSDPAMDAALAKVRLAGSQSDLKAALSEVQKVWNDTAPSVIYSAVEQAVAWGSKVKGLTFGLATTVLFDRAYIAS
ncbi:MAG: ABC transporter substrate-binding protein [Acidimicrobiales bacterium]